VPATAQNECAWAHLLLECTPRFPRGHPVRKRPTTASHPYHRKHIAVPSILRPSAYLPLLTLSSRTCHSPRNLPRRGTPSRTRSFTARSSSPPRPPKTRRPGRKNLRAAIWMTHWRVRTASVRMAIALISRVCSGKQLGRLRWYCRCRHCKHRSSDSRLHMG
jgi:hypothetical protein